MMIEQGGTHLAIDLQQYNLFCFISLHLGYGSCRKCENGKMMLTLVSTFLHQGMWLMKIETRKCCKMSMLLLFS